MSVDSVIVIPKKSFASMIGWLSACLLAAGWGPRLNLQLRDQWVLIGCFGLAAAVGLELSNRLRFGPMDDECRSARPRPRRAGAPQRAARARTEATSQQDPLVGVADALRRIFQDRDLRHVPSSGSQSEPKPLFSESIVVRHLAGGSLAKGELEPATMSAQVRNISRDGVRLLHKERIGGSRFVLPFVLSGGDTISLLVEIQWQHQLADGFYHSGGKWLKVSADDCVADLTAREQPQPRRTLRDLPSTAWRWLRGRLPQLAG